MLAAAVRLPALPSTAAAVRPHALPSTAAAVRPPALPSTAAAAGFGSRPAPRSLLSAHPPCHNLRAAPMRAHASSDAWRPACSTLSSAQLPPAQLARLQCTERHAGRYSMRFEGRLWRRMAGP